MNLYNYYSEEEIIDLTRLLVSIPSHCDYEGREKEVAEALYKFAQDNGLESEIISVDGERKNVMIYYGEGLGGKTLLLNGHIDTVPPYNMSIEPYSGEVRDGFLFGRGSNDMKGAVACMVMSIIALKRMNANIRGRIIVSAVIGEEERSEGTEHLVTSGFKADGAIVGEPSNYEYALGHRGLEWLEIVFKGKAAHGGMPSLGINAILMAAKFINRVEKDLVPEISKRHNEYMGQSVMNFGKIIGGNQPSTVADWCKLQLDRRYIPGESYESVIKEYQDIIDSLKLEDPGFDAEIIRMENNMLTLDHTYLLTNPDESIVSSVVSVLKDIIGKEPEITRNRGWTDAALLSHYGGIPTVVVGPGDIKYSHTKDERIPVKDLVEFVNIYGRIALDFCNQG